MLIKFLKKKAATVEATATVYICHHVVAASQPMSAAYNVHADVRRTRGKSDTGVRGITQHPTPLTNECLPVSVQQAWNYKSQHPTRGARLTA